MDQINSKNNDDVSFFRIGVFELICTHTLGDGETSEPAPHFCKYGYGRPGNYCTENKCKYISSVTMPSTLCYTDKDGFVHREESFHEGIHLDFEDMDANYLHLLGIWKDICTEKINEAYEDYMIKRQEYLDSLKK